MKCVKLLSIGALLAGLAAIGCDNKKSEPTKPSEKTSAAGETTLHQHGKGPNGGVIFDIGKYHAEITVNHDKKECMIVLLGPEEKNPQPAKAAVKDLTVITKETKTKDGKVIPSMTIKMVAKDEADGKAGKFVGTDPGLGNEAEHAGDVTATIDGKPAQGEFKE